MTWPLPPAAALLLSRQFSAQRFREGCHRYTATWFSRVQRIRFAGML